MSYDAIVFDNDGVLTEPTDLAVLRESIRQTFGEFGVDPPEDHVDAMIGTTAATVETVCEAHGIDPADFWYRRDANASRAQREEIRRGNKPLYDDVDAVSGLDPALGIVSNNQHRTVEFIADFFDLDAFDPVYGREPTVAGIHRKKPDPHYLDRALSDLGTRNALYVGDSNVDVAAAAAAGVDSAFVRRPHRADYDLEREPTYEVDALDELGPLVADPDRAGSD